MVTASLPRPDLLLYLQAPVPVLLERIHQRGQAIEGGITEDYLSLLESFYAEWLETFDLCPVLTIGTSDLGFVHQAPRLDIVAGRILDRLAGKEEVPFGAGA
jgi:deoxyadenosine/deoxycytidine kinase